LIVAELSRLARSVGQIAILVDALLKKKARVVSLKENITLKGRADIQTKAMITMFSLFAEIERDLISERTKEGLARARAEGKLLGRPKGKKGKSKLDGTEKGIKEYLAKGVTRANIAKIYGVSFPALQNFIVSSVAPPRRSRSFQRACFAARMPKRRRTAEYPPNAMRGG
jgi:DNA invertase Pin-like site-specific DNA recombinase